MIELSPDRMIFWFFIGWFALTASLIILDWVANPNRGGFRPKGDRRPTDRVARRSSRIRTRAERDAGVRATLRDAYGASSLRLSWTRANEDAVRRDDDTLVVSGSESGAAAVDTPVLDAPSRELVTPDYTAVVGDPLPNIAEISPPGLRIGWELGADPLVLTRAGNLPSAATIRTRVWKNHGCEGGWDSENLARLRTGKVPRRHNPITGATQTATVDVVTGLASWGDTGLDPFGQQS